MRVGLAQIDAWVGDLEGNVGRCVVAAERAAAAGAELVVLPELALAGYPPRDLLFDPDFVEAVLAATRDLAVRVAGGPPVLVGTLARAAQAPPRHPGLLDVAALLQGGAVRAQVAKRLLPAYDVFHEPRWFLPGAAQAPLEIGGRRVGVLVCEDLWDEGYPEHPPAELRAAGAELIVCLAASPYRRGVREERWRHARRAGLPVVHVNLAGAQDELVFDGRSFALDAGGRLLRELAGFREEVAVVDLDAVASADTTVERASTAGEPPWPELHAALVAGIRGFAEKNRLARAVVGLSGGVDSAVVARLAADALGPRRLTALAIPSRHTDPASTEAARTIAHDLGIGFESVPLQPLHAAAEATLAPLLDGSEAAELAAENLQARLRMLLLMAFVNRHGGFLLNTSNKTELALGYGTLYGDLAGALAPIGDLIKPEVVGLARWLGGLPSFVLERAPSAELRPGQVDPFDYAVLAPRVETLVQSQRSDAALRRSEHKRRQLGIVLKLSATAFGSGRLVPVARR